MNDQDDFDHLALTRLALTSNNKVVGAHGVVVVGTLEVGAVLGRVVSSNEHQFRRKDESSGVQTKAFAP